MFGEDIWGRPLLFLGVSLVLAGIQFLTFGLIAELMMRIYFESQNKKPYTIRTITQGRKLNTKNWYSYNYALFNSSNFLS